MSKTAGTGFGGEIKDEVKKKKNKNLFNVIFNKI